MVTEIRTEATATAFLARADLGALIDALHAAGRTLIGPTVEDGAIVYAEIESASDLPIGWRDEQAPGRYRLAQHADQRAFGYTVGPTSWKRYTFPSRPAYTSPLPVRMAAESAPGPRFVTAVPPPLPRVTRVVSPVRLLVTRAVCAHWSPRTTALEPQLP